MSDRKCNSVSGGHLSFICGSGLEENGELVIYDPWDGNIGTYTIDEAFYTGFLSAQGKGF